MLHKGNVIWGGPRWMDRRGPVRKEVRAAEAKGTACSELWVQQQASKKVPNHLCLLGLMPLYSSLSSWKKANLCNPWNMARTTVWFPRQGRKRHYGFSIMPSWILHCGVISLYVVTMLKQPIKKPLEEELRVPDGNQSHVRAILQADPLAKCSDDRDLPDILPATSWDTPSHNQTANHFWIPVRQ